MKQKQQSKIVSKTILPPAELLLKGDMVKRATCFNNWILSRPGIQWMQSRPSLPPTPLPMKFWRELIFTGFASGLSGQIQGQKRETVQRMIQDYGLDFTVDGVLCVKGNSARITPFPKGEMTTWRNQRVYLNPKAPPSGSITTEILWEMSWINFRFDLFRLDSLMLVPGEKNDENAFSARFLKVWRVLENVEDCEHERLAFVRDFPEADFGITHSDPEVRIIFLHRFAEVVCEWGEALSPTLTKWKRNPSLVSCAELEAGVFEYFCQTFVNFFGVLPSVPRHVPSSIPYEIPYYGPTSSS